MRFYFFQSFVGVVVFGCHVSLCWCVLCVRLRLSSDGAMARDLEFNELS